MDFNVATLEAADHIIHFHYYETLVANNADQDLLKIKNKYAEHLAIFFPEISFRNNESQLIPLPHLYELILNKLKGMKSGDIHLLIERLEKDAKKIRKFYKAQLANSK
ncbi:hypothetical protein [Mucilaginibacter terrae]|uniref:Archaellum component FlaD/FlaE n=1 Tax=Mucilaginibacter terrae TaxID=1955052 RepID=A0ABU3GRH0_9SPHI|nr:hypothetical protein [Mucilaginibacter terrae]MDT3402374.1 archaellum component FlaD/FlaE [Mucilaginibacter terrae]